MGWWRARPQGYRVTVPGRIGQTLYDVAVMHGVRLMYDTRAREHRAECIALADSGSRLGCCMAANAIVCIAGGAILS